MSEDVTAFAFLLLAQVELLPCDILDKLILFELLAGVVLVQFELAFPRPDYDELRNYTAGENRNGGNDAQGRPPSGVCDQVLLVVLFASHKGLGIVCNVLIIRIFLYEPYHFRRIFLTLKKWGMHLLFP